MPDGCWMVKYANFIQPKLPFFFISFVVLAIARIKSRMDEEAREKRREFILSRLQSFQD